jgi:hypothetical protein|tara:strand:- start:7107 stop:7583 length:477 start_codon:yes stop_codon:yes gene_type:complete
MKIEAFRKIIREEVRDVIKEELSLIMQTPITETKTVQKPVVEQKTKTNSLSELIEEKPRQPQQPSKPTKPLFEGVGAIADVLNQTHAEGGWRNLNGGMTAQDAVGFSGGMPGEATKVVQSADDMLASAPKTTDMNQVKIDAVPDFSGLMSTLKDQGKL